MFVLEFSVDKINSVCKFVQTHQNDMNVDDLNKILDREFRRLREEKQGEYRSVNEMAEFFGPGISTSLLYKWKNGERDISRKGARQIAAAFRKNDISGAEQLEKELLKTTQPSSVEDLEIATWFDQHASEANLMAVEFRELPVLSSQEGKNQYLMSVAKAVAKGLSYAVILPFGTSPSCLSKLRRPLRRYIDDLAKHVMGLYSDVLFEAFEETVHIHRDKSESELKAELIKVHGRLQLYILNADDVPPCPAIGYRLFYVAKRDPVADEVRSTEPRDGERWEWVSSRERHHMIRKASSSDELEATTIRYFPIVEFWRERRRLARTAAEMTDFAKEMEDREAFMTQNDINEDSISWNVFRENKAAADVVNEYLRSANK